MSAIDDILKEKRAERKRLATQLATLDKQIKGLQAEVKPKAKPVASKVKGGAKKK